MPVKKDEIFSISWTISLGANTVTPEFRKLRESDFFFPVLRDLACLEIEGEKLGLEMVSKTEYLD